MDTRLAPIHPGEILQEDYLTPMGITEYYLAKSIGVQPTRINQIVKGKRAITADTSIRLGRFFGLPSSFWLNIQTRYEIESVLISRGHEIKQEVMIWQD